MRASSIAAAAAMLADASALTASATSSRSSAPSTSVNAAQWMTASGEASSTRSWAIAGLVRSPLGRSTPTASQPRARASATTRWPSMPAAPVIRILTGLEDRDVSVVAHHEAVGARLARAAADVHVAAQQRGLHAAVKAAHRRAGEQDRVLDLGALDRAVLTDRGVGPDVAVGQRRARADDRGAADGRARQRRARLDDDAALDGRRDQLALDAVLHAVEDQPVGLEHVVQAAGVLPPALHDVRLDAL